jgi:hypothetical protein
MRRAFQLTVQFVFILTISFALLPAAQVLPVAAQTRDVATIEAEIKQVAATIEALNSTIRSNRAEIAALTELHAKYRQYQRQFARMEADIAALQKEADAFHENTFYNREAETLAKIAEIRRRIALMRVFKTLTYDDKKRDWVETDLEPGHVITFGEDKFTSFAELEAAALKANLLIADFKTGIAQAETQLKLQQEVMDLLQKERDDAIAAVGDSSDGTSPGTETPDQTEPGTADLSVDNILGNWLMTPVNNTVIQFTVTRKDNTGQAVLDAKFVKEGLEDYDMAIPADHALFRFVIRVKPRPGTPADQEDYVGQAWVKNGTKGSWLQVYLRLRGNVLVLVAEDGTDALTFTRLE